MISVNDFRTGLTIEVDGGIWRVVDFQHVKPGKGAAFVRSKLRNLRTGAIQEKTFRAGEKVAKAQIETKTMQYLYANGDQHVFMDTSSYEQLELNENQIEEELKYLLENMSVHIMMYQSETLGIELPNTVELKVVETEPGIKGDTASLPLRFKLYFIYDHCRHVRLFTRSDRSALGADFRQDCAYTCRSRHLL